MSNPFQLTFTLRQHTPIIHFQHEQEGATLRTTEVKPKLDRFIIAKMGGKDKMDKSWFNNYEMGSLDYKLRIDSCVDETLKFVIASRFKNDQLSVLNKELPSIAPSPFFAQETEYKYLFNTEKKKIREYVNGREETKEIDIPVSVNNDVLNDVGKFGVVNDLSKNFSVAISCYHSKLLKKLGEHLTEFLVTENFGTRQSKGFGVFTVESKTDGTNYSVIDFENDLNNNFKFVYKKTIPKRYTDTKDEAFDLLMQDIFKIIQYDYQYLKSGIGATRPNDANYRKSKLFLHGVSNYIRWEKRKIKQLINAKTISHNGNTYKLKSFLPPSVDGNKSNNNWKDSTPLNYQYLRAVLGLAEQLEFLTTGGRNSDKIIVQIKSLTGIERFRSPILFKVFDNHLYLVGNDVDENILNGKDFEFKYFVKAGRTPSSPSSLTTLKTPHSFDLGAFIKAGILGMNYKALKEV